MKWLVAAIVGLMPVFANAEVDAETQLGWAAFKEVCLAQVSDVKTAIQTIPELARKHTGNRKITDAGYRKKQLIPEGDDAWSFNDGNQWFMIITDYGKCAVRVPGSYTGAHEATVKHGYKHFSSIDTKWNHQEFYYSVDDGKPILVIVHTINKGEKRLAFVAINREVYRLAITKYGSDYPQLPE